MFLITGYPKTGNTWLLVMFSYIINPKSMIDGNAEPPRNYVFSHCMPYFNSSSYSDLLIRIRGNLSRKRVVLLIRHPGDTLVSLYMHNVYRENFPMYDGTIDEMVYDDKYGIKKYLAYYELWYKHQKEAYLFSIIRYEDLLKDPYQTLLTTLTAIRLNVPLQIIQDAIEFGQFENMKRLEETNHLNWATLRQSSQKTKRARKVREGKTGGYRKLLKPETVKYIDKCVIENLHPIYGYL